MFTALAVFVAGIAGDLAGDVAGGGNADFAALAGIAGIVADFLPELLPLMWPKWLTPGLLG